jgi:polysaccharide biosynthesis transport protein
MTNPQNDSPPAARQEELALDRPVARPAALQAAHDRYGYDTHAPDDSSINFREVWAAIRKRKLMIIALSLTVTLVVGVEVFRAKSIYRASAVVEIGKEAGTTLIKTGDVILQTDDTEDINTKILFLQSRLVLEDVVVNLKLDQNRTFTEAGRQQGRWDAVKTAAASVGRRFGLESPKPSEQDARPLRAVTERVADAAVQRTPAERTRLLPYVEAVRAGLAVEQVKETHALLVSYTHADPALSAAVANEVAESFIRRSFQGKTERFSQTSSWLERSTRELKAQVQRAEQEMADYTRANNIYSLEGKETLTGDRLATLHAQVMKAETDRLIKQSLYEEVRQGRVAQLPDAFADPRAVELRKKLGELSVQKAEASSSYGPDNPNVVVIQEQVDDVRGQLAESTRALAERLRADYERAARDEAALQTALTQAKGEAARENQAAIQFSVLRQNVETAKSLYNSFLQKTKQADIELIEQVNNLRVLEPAEVPGGPIGPPRFRSMLLALILSLAAGVGLSVFLEYLDNTIKSTEDISRHLGLPTLAVVPVIKEAEKGVLSRSAAGIKKSLKAPEESAEEANRPRRGGYTHPYGSRSAAAEAYRMLRTSLLLSSADSPPRRLLVTSAQPGEGKTTTAANTAISLAQLGHSVLVVDCDMRKPSAHKLFGVQATQGVSSYLSGKGSLAGFIQPTKYPNLDLLPCGQIPPNPAELLSSERMKRMLKLLSEHYDYILIDSPPMIHVADPVILSSLVDGVVLVVQAGKSTRAASRRARSDLSAVNAKLLGAILNNLDLQRHGYGYYYYYQYRYYGRQTEGETTREA